MHTHTHTLREVLAGGAPENLELERERERERARCLTFLEREGLRERFHPLRLPARGGVPHRGHEIACRRHHHVLLHRSPRLWLAVVVLVRRGQGARARFFFGLGGTAGCIVSRRRPRFPFFCVPIAACHLCYRCQLCYTGVICVTGVPSFGAIPSVSLKFPESRQNGLEKNGVKSLTSTLVP